MRRLFPSALTNYDSLLEAEPDMVALIELTPTDEIFTDKFGCALSETIRNRNDIIFTVNSMENMLFTTRNGNDSDGFPTDETKTEEIVEYINSANETAAGCDSIKDI
ncbi:unnamed protein product [Rotaria sp. Silwood2]|nr:unnamed protein product [Rotaria sp. Silwood2]